jgi:hypothetical protein
LCCYAAVLQEVSGKESVVYKCVAESDKGGFDAWLNKAIDTYGVNAYNLVGGASSANQYSGPTIPDVAAKLNKHSQCAHGGVTIAERHIKKGNEHETLMKKSELGMQWFISQAIYDPEPMIKLLKEYGALCKKKGVAPKRVILTFAPCGREKTMRFIKWLGVTVPEDVEKEILEAENKVGKSVDLLCGMCKKILEETKGCGVPLGISVESVSIFKNEIDAAHDLFRRTQSMLLDFLGEPWLVRYSIVDKKSKRTSFDYGEAPIDTSINKQTAKSNQNQIQWNPPPYIPEWKCPYIPEWKCYVRTLHIGAKKPAAKLALPSTSEGVGAALMGDKKSLITGGVGLAVGFVLSKLLSL